MEQVIQGGTDQKGKRGSRREGRGGCWKKEERKEGIKKKKVGERQKWRGREEKREREREGGKQYVIESCPVLVH